MAIGIDKLSKVKLLETISSPFIEISYQCKICTNNIMSVKYINVSQNLHNKHVFSDRYN